MTQAAPQPYARGDAAPRPRPAQLIRVLARDEERSTAQVMRVGRRTLELRLTDLGPEAARELVEAPSVTVEFLGDGAIHRLVGRAQLYATVQGTSLLVLLDAEQEAGRRAHVRIDLDAPATLRNVGTGERVEARTVNMSMGGMLVRDLSAPLTVDRAYGFAIAPEDLSEPITGVAKIVRVESETRAALAITVLSNPSTVELARILFERAAEPPAGR